MTKYGRAKRAAFVRHPDSDRVTRRIPFLQLRDMVMALTEDAENDPAYAASVAAKIAELDDAVCEFDDDIHVSDVIREFEAAPTTYRASPRHDAYPPQHRLDTIDALIEALPDR